MKKTKNLFLNVILYDQNILLILYCVLITVYIIFMFFLTSILYFQFLVGIMSMIFLFWLISFIAFNNKINSEKGNYIFDIEYNDNKSSYKNFLLKLLNFKIYSVNFLTDNIENVVVITCNPYKGNVMRLIKLDENIYFGK